MITIMIIVALLFICFLRVIDGIILIDLGVV